MNNYNNPVSNFEILNGTDIQHYDPTGAILNMESMTNDSIYTKLLDSMKSIFGGTSKNLNARTIESFEASKDVCVLNVLPIINALRDDTGAIKYIDSSSEFKDVFRSIRDGKSNKSMLDIISKTEFFLKEVLDNETAFKNKINLVIGKNADEKTLTIKQIGLIKLIDSIRDVSEYFMNLTCYAIQGSSKGLDGKYELNVKTKAGAFIEKLNESPLKALYSIDELSDVSVYSLVSRDIPSPYVIGDMYNSFDRYITNFIGNPIYHFRKYLVDRDVKRRDEAIEKRTYIELRLSKLKLEKSGNPDDPQLDKQIEYFEDKLMSIDAYIDKLERI